MLTAKDLEKLSHHKQVMFALFCAKQVEHLIELKEDKECIRLVELWLAGKATSEQCRVAGNAAAAYAAANAIHATYATANAANAAANTAKNVIYAAAIAAKNVAYAIKKKDKDRVLKEQKAYYEELLNIDKNFEKIILEA